MEQFLTQIPTTPIGWVSVFVVCVGAGVYLVSRIRMSDMDLLRKANGDLRKDNDDNRLRIDALQTDIKILNGKVEVLEKQNKTLEDLVITSLKQYFYEHPEVARGIQKALLGS